MPMTPRRSYMCTCLSVSSHPSMGRKEPDGPSTGLFHSDSKRGGRRPVFVKTGSNTRTLLCRGGSDSSHPATSTSLAPLHAGLSRLRRGHPPLAAWALIRNKSPRPGEAGEGVHVNAVYLPEVLWPWTEMRYRGRHNGFAVLSLRADR